MKNSRLEKHRVLRLAQIAALAIVVAMAAQAVHSGAPEPVTLTFLYNDWYIPDRLPGPITILEDFTRETGIRVKLLPPPEGALNEMDLWRELLQKGSPTPDVYGIDVIWPGSIGNYFLNLKPYLAPELSVADPTLLKQYSLGGKVVGMPYHTNVATLLYRTDLLRKYGYNAPPKTWDELEKMAARIQSGERAAGQKDFWGYVWQGSAGEALTCNALEWQFAAGGGRIIEDDGTISVNNPRAIHAWERAARWVGTISPPGVVAYREWDSTNVWASGNAAFHRAWESDARLKYLEGPSVGNTIVGSPMNGRVGVTSMPAGLAGRASTLGGSALAISQFSKHPQEALALIRFLLKNDNPNNQIRPKQRAPIQPEFYEVPGILDRGPTPVQRNALWNGVITRPSIVTGDKYEEVARAYIEAVHSVLTRERNADDAARSLEKELMAITGLKKSSLLDSSRRVPNENTGVKH
jgi:trehalose/maltose transport system substrate-binding protein